MANLFGYLAFSARGDLFSDPGALSVSAVKEGELWRLVTYQFLHSGIFELIFSLFLLVLFAVLVEQRYGRRATALCYLLSGTVGGLVAVAVNSGVVAAGSTVSTFGLIGMWLVMNSRPRSYERQYPVYAGLTLAGLLMLYGALQGGIELWSQVGGLATGVCCGVVAERVSYSSLDDF